MNKVFSNSLSLRYLKYILRYTRASHSANSAAIHAASGATNRSVLGPATQNHAAYGATTY